MSDPRPLLSVRDLRTWLATGDAIVRAVDGISFDVQRGEGARDIPSPPIWGERARVRGERETLHPFTLQHVTLFHVTHLKMK